MHMRRIRQSLVTRLLLMGIFLIVGGAVVRYVTLTHFLRTDLTTVVAAQQEALASYVARDIDFRVLERQRMLAQLAHSLPPALLRHPDRLRAWLIFRPSPAAKRPTMRIATMCSRRCRATLSSDVRCWGAPPTCRCCPWPRPSAMSTARCGR